MYAKEAKMQEVREQEDKSYRESMTEYLSSDEEDIEENFAWYRDTDPNTYFCLCTRTKNMIEKD